MRSKELNRVDLCCTDSAHGMDLEALKAQDPEFYQYLQEHDKDLLDFDPEAAGADDASDVEMAESTAGGKKRKAQKQTVLTKDLLKSWQRAILEVGLPSLVLLRNDMS